MSNNVHKKVIDGHSADLQDALVYKDLYENMMDDLLDFDANKFEAIDEKYLEAFEGTEEEKLAQAKKNPGVVLGALKATCDDLQTDI
jgi:hypothetical protein